MMVRQQHKRTSRNSSKGNGQSCGMRNADENKFLIIKSDVIHHSNSKIEFLIIKIYFSLLRIPSFYETFHSICSDSIFSHKGLLFIYQMDMRKHLLVLE